MSEKAIVDAFKKILSSESKKLGHLAGFPDNANVIMDLKMGTDKFGEAFEKGMKAVYKPYVAKGLLSEQTLNDDVDAKVMKKFIENNQDEPTIRESISCFCKYSILTCEETTLNRKNGFTDFYRVIFDGIIKLMDELSVLKLASEFIDHVCKKLWQEHEELLARINIEQSEKFKHAR